MFQYIRVAAVFFLLIQVLAACSGKGAAVGETNSGPAASYRIGLVTDFAGVEDGSANESAWNGLQQWSKTSGAKINVLESTDESDYVANATRLAEEDWDLILGVGFLLEGAMLKAAGWYPESKFAIIDGVVDAPNVESVVFKEHEGAFLVGAVAGLMTETGKLGFVGGMDNEEIRRYESGFRAGVAAVRADAEVTTSFTSSFIDVAAGASAAAQLYDAGSDIVFHAAGAAGDGIFSEALLRREQGANVWVIGSGEDQAADFGHAVTLTSMLKRTDRAVAAIMESFVRGSFTAGGTIELGIAAEAVGLPESMPNVPQEVLATVREYADRIAMGDIVVPEAPDGAEASE